MDIKSAVLLVGGLGTRLRPITYEIPKALMPVHGKTIAEHFLDLLKRHNVTDVVLCVGYLKERIKAHFMDGSHFGVNITYVEEETPLGTAGPLRLGAEMHPSNFSGPMIVSNGDELKDVDLGAMYRLHKKSKALVTIALTRVEDPSTYGVAKLEGSRILEFVEKPKKEDAPSNLINSGLYIMEPEVIKMIPEGSSMLEKEIFPKLARQGKLSGFIFDGQWFDVGNLERYDLALKNWKGIK